MPDKDTCEALIDGEWMLMSVAEAHIHHRAAKKRCPACHGQVRTHGTYVAQQRVAMTHLRSHDGCPRIVQRYTGVPTPHPEALT
ncbi:hypothetical protein [Methylobacterium sp. J-067]|uniref:hypothetical protein n=1 Tax=Methylobacterium sp. J-067 TaxID=2836648 RepID=UPI001FBB8787|nr:hypothetical protein [Methylobacterium sp. J-067]MCJ2023920.1 hypothetical protein [Methylobacterium sp. J-067]